MFRFKLKGAGVSPSTVPINDFIEIGTAIQRSINPLAKQLDNENDSTQDISLVEVKEGSSDYGLHFHSQKARQGWEQIYSAMHSDQYDGLPEQTINNLRNINNFIKKREYSALEFSEQETYRSGSIEITKNNLLKIPEEEILESPTNIYGKLLRIGGTNPSLVIELPNGQSLTCSIGEKLARKISSKLYQDIGLEGTAYWKIPGWELKEFSVKKETEYESTKHVYNTFSELKNSIDGEFDDIENLDSFIKNLRGK